MLAWSANNFKTWSRSHPTLPDAGVNKCLKTVDFFAIINLYFSLEMNTSIVTSCCVYLLHCWTETRLRWTDVGALSFILMLQTKGVKVQIECWMCVQILNGLLCRGMTWTSERGSNGKHKGNEHLTVGGNSTTSLEYTPLLSGRDCHNRSHSIFLESCLCQSISHISNLSGAQSSAVLVKGNLSVHSMCPSGGKCWVLISCLESPDCSWKWQSVPQLCCVDRQKAERETALKLHWETIEQMFIVKTEN